MDIQTIDDGRLYYKIGEVAQILGESTSLVRFWSDYFPQFRKVSRTENKRNRQFTPDDVRLLQKIHHLVKEQGLTLDGANKRLQSDGGELDVQVAVIKRLTALRDELKEIHDLL